MKVSVNGKTTRIAATTLTGLLTELGVATDRRGIAIAVDGAVVPRSDWNSTRLTEGAAIEFVGAVQGG